MAVSQDTKQAKRMGRPPKTDEISLEKIQEIALDYSKMGKFWFELPAAIHAETGVKCSHSWLDSIKDEDFLGTKSLCFAYCVSYWSKQIQLGGVPSAVFIFVMKNVAKWNDNKSITLDANVETKDNPDKARQNIEAIKAMLAEKS